MDRRFTKCFLCSLFSFFFPARICTCMFSRACQVAVLQPVQWHTCLLPIISARSRWATSNSRTAAWWGSLSKAKRERGRDCQTFKALLRVGEGGVRTAGRYRRRERLLSRPCLSSTHMTWWRRIAASDQGRAAAICGGWGRLKVQAPQQPFGEGVSPVGLVRSELADWRIPI